MRRVFRAATLLQVAHARNVLIAAGIPCELRNQYLAGALGDLPMMETWPQLYVEEADEQPALRALARAVAAPTGSSWDCERCGERIEPQFTHCWRCGAACSFTWPAADGSSSEAFGDGVRQFPTGNIAKSE